MKPTSLHEVFYIGEYIADYSEVTREQLNEPQSELDELFKNSRLIVANKDPDMKMIRRLMAERDQLKELIRSSERKIILLEAAIAEYHGENDTQAQEEGGGVANSKITS